MNFPDYCIRGIDDSKHIIPASDSVRLELYLPNTKTSQKRTDSGSETSINWEDNPEVLNFTLKFWNKEKNRIAFPHGAVRLAKAEIDRIITNPVTLNTISYEREKQDGNDYHGNIVFRANMPQVLQNLIASTLATYSSSVERLSDQGKNS